MKKYLIIISGVPENGNAMIKLTKLYNVSEDGVKEFRDNFNIAVEQNAKISFDTNFQGGIINDRATIRMAEFAFIKMEVVEQHR
jgi:hypothetical protein